ncbi:MAG: hypothetical protein LBP55_09070 [Candidatus Adiutrix sp.]|jgi:hypothetical protein|nr:hypothetical protein [Candidatus Adiutrix sp.]
MPKITVIALSLIFYYGGKLNTSFWLKVWALRGMNITEDHIRLLRKVGLAIWAIGTIAAYILFNVYELGIGGQF